jgi:putative DNA primase/helicase
MDNIEDFTKYIAENMETDYEPSVEEDNTLFPFDDYCIPEIDITKLTIMYDDGADIPNGTNIYNRIVSLKPEQNYNWDEQALAELFADIHSEECKFNTDRNCWCIYNGVFWENDRSGILISRKMKEFHNALDRYAANEINNYDTKNNYKKFLGLLGNFKKREAIIKDARDKHTVVDNDFNKNPLLINCLNGTYNLELRIFKKHDSRDMLSKVANVKYVPSTVSPLLDKFINDIMCNDSQLISYLWRTLGYAITGLAKEECMFILYGPTTRNGKSTLIFAMTALLGNGEDGYVKTMRAESLASKRFADGSKASGDIARLKGARFVACSELEKSMKLNEALIKELTGRDIVTSRNLYVKETENETAFKIFLNTNHLPEISDNTLLVSGRIKVIPFNQHFDEHSQNKNLKELLISEEVRSSLLNKCIAGYQDYEVNGLKEPQVVKDALKGFRPREELFEEFIKDYLILDNKSIITAKETYETYCRWCLNEVGTESMSKSYFFSLLKNNSLMYESGTIGGKSIRKVIKGYSLKQLQSEKATADEFPF